MITATDRPAPPPPGWYWRLPSLTLPLFLMVIAALVWLTHNYDQEEQKNALLSDVLWMEQNLRFHLERNEGQLLQLAEELLPGQTPRLAPSPQADPRLRQLLAPDSALVRIVWADPQGHVLGARPPPGGTPLTLSTDLVRIAQGLGRPTYGPAHQQLGKTYFEVHVPYYSEGVYRGTVVGMYALEQLLSREIPWWFSERYRVAAVSADGIELAAKSKVAPLANNLEYTIPFEPPGHGVRLSVTAYKAETRWIPILLMATLVLLAGIIIWSLVQMRRHLIRRLAAQHALREAMNFRKAMEDSLLTGLRARDLAGRITYVNPAFCKMVGYTAEELYGQLPPMPYWDPADIPTLPERQAQSLAGKAPVTGVERRLINKNGQAFDALIFDAPLIDADGRHTGWMGSVLDITEQKRMREFARQQEERLQATARLVTMGEMASTLAHELNQPLAAISSYSAGCINRLEAENWDASELKGILLKLGKQAQRAGLIIKRVHDFVRRSEPKREPVSLTRVVQEAIALIEPDSRKRHIRLEYQHLTALPPVDADPLMVEQVAVNLIRNAMDAMAPTPPHLRQVKITTLADKDYVTLLVADRGSGVDPDIAQRLFEPFYTTKVEGMGMGLNICRSIAELHHGKLSFEPNPGGGTIFKFSLPVPRP